MSKQPKVQLTLAEKVAQGKKIRIVQMWWMICGGMPGIIYMLVPKSRKKLNYWGMWTLSKFLKFAEWRVTGEGSALFGGNGTTTTNANGETVHYDMNGNVTRRKIGDKYYDANGTQIGYEVDGVTYNMDGSLDTYKIGDSKYNGDHQKYGYNIDNASGADKYDTEGNKTGYKIKK